METLQQQTAPRSNSCLHPSLHALGEVQIQWRETLKCAVDQQIISPEEYSESLRRINGATMFPSHLARLEAIEAAVGAARSFQQWEAEGVLPSVLTHWAITSTDVSLLPQRKNQSTRLVALFNDGVFNKADFYKLICVEDLACQHDLIASALAMVKRFEEQPIHEKMATACEYRRMLDNIHPGEIAAVYYTRLGIEG